MWASPWVIVWVLLAGMVRFPPFTSTTSTAVEGVLCQVWNQTFCDCAVCDQDYVLTAACQNVGARKCILDGHVEGSDNLYECCKRGPLSVFAIVLEVVGATCCCCGCGIICYKLWKRRQMAAATAHAQAMRMPVQAVGIAPVQAVVYTPTAGAHGARAPVVGEPCYGIPLAMATATGGAEYHNNPWKWGWHPHPSTQANFPLKGNVKQHLPNPHRPHLRHLPRKHPVRRPQRDTSKVNRQITL